MEEPYHINVQDWFFKQGRHDNYNDDNDPRAVFNVLDAVLVDTMERLKKLRLVYMFSMYASWNETQLLLALILLNVCNFVLLFHSNFHCTLRFLAC